MKMFFKRSAKKPRYTVPSIEIPFRDHTVWDGDHLIAAYQIAGLLGIYSPRQARLAKKNEPHMAHTVLANSVIRSVGIEWVNYHSSNKFDAPNYARLFVDVFDPSSIPLIIRELSRRSTSEDDPEFGKVYTYKKNVRGKTMAEKYRYLKYVILP